MKLLSPFEQQFHKVKEKCTNHPTICIKKPSESTKYTDFTIFSEDINNGTEVITSVPRKNKIKSKINNPITQNGCIQSQIWPLENTNSIDSHDWYMILYTLRKKYIYFFHFKHWCNLFVCTRWKQKKKKINPSVGADALKRTTSWTWRGHGRFKGTSDPSRSFYSRSWSFYCNYPMLRCREKKKWELLRQ